MSKNPPANIAEQPDFISTQVAESRHYYFDQSQRDGDISIICGGCERMRSDYVIDRDDFPYFTIEYVAQGKGSLHLSGSDYQLSAGMAFAYAPKMKHLIKSDADKPMVKHYVTFTGKKAKKLLSESVLGSWKVVQLALPHEISDIFELMHREGSSEGLMGHRLCVTLLDFLVAKITQEAVPYGTLELRALETFQRAKRIIHEHYLIIKSAQEVANLCNIDNSYLSRLFKRYADVSPYKLIMKMKMKHAAELLISRRMLVKEVAGELGFIDPYHFSHAFKRVYGVSPQQFIRARSTLN